MTFENETAEQTTETKPAHLLCWGDEMGVPGVFRVPDGSIEKLQAKIVKLNRRAAKLGMPAIALSILGQANRLVCAKTFDNDGNVVLSNRATVVRVDFYVTVEGQRPQVAGWELAAVLEYLGEAGNIIRTVPTFGEAIPARYRQQAQHCEHCRTLRARKDTVVLHHEDGSFKQVGRNCLADFLPGTSIETLARYAEYLLEAVEACREDEDGEGGSYGPGERRLVPGTFLGFVAAAVRARGWMSRGKARESMDGKTATADLALMVMFPPRAAHKVDPELKPTEADFERAKAALEFAREYFENNEPKGDYEYNLSVLVKLGAWTMRHTGLGGSILPFVERLQGKMAERAAQREASNYVGTVGERQILKLTLVGSVGWEGNYGVTYFLRFVEGNGNVVVWKASQPLDKPVPSGNPEFPWKREDVKINETVELLATVKEHSEYKGVKQTIINRGVVLVGEELEKEKAKLAKKAARAAKKAQNNP